MTYQLVKAKEAPLMADDIDTTQGPTIDPRTQVEGPPGGKRKRKRKRGPLQFRMHRDYDVAQPHAEGCVVLRVFAPVKKIRPDHRFLILRREFRTSKKFPDGRFVAIYRGDVDFDGIRLDDLDIEKFYYGAAEAKRELHELQTRYEERKERRRGSFYRSKEVEVMHRRKPAHSSPLTHGLEIPAGIVEAVQSLPQAVDSKALQKAEEKLAKHIVEEVDTSPQEPKTPTPFTDVVRGFRRI